VKKGLSLVEVLVAIVLLSVVIGAMLQIKSNNMFLLKRFNKNSESNSYISMTADINEFKDQTIRLENVVKNTDDTLRREFKQHKVEVRVSQDKIIKMPPNDYIQTASIKKAKYTLDNKNSKLFYKFELELK